MRKIHQVQQKKSNSSPQVQTRASLCRFHGHQSILLEGVLDDVANFGRVPQDHLQLGMRHVIQGRHRIGAQNDFGAPLQQVPDEGQYAENYVHAAVVDKDRGAPVRRILLQPLYPVVQAVLQPRSVCEGASKLNSQILGHCSRWKHEMDWASTKLNEGNKIPIIRICQVERTTWLNIFADTIYYGLFDSIVFYGITAWETSYKNAIQTLLKLRQDAISC